MLKPDKVRQVIERANPYLVRDPEKLQVFLEGGTIECRGSTSLSYEYRYTLSVIVQDYPHHADQLILPLLALLRTEQPELFENPDKAAKLIRFDAEVLSSSQVDLALQVDLTERVIVKQDAGGVLTLKHVGEPPHPQFPEQQYEMTVIYRRDGQELGRYTVPAWEPRFG